MGGGARTPAGLGSAAAWPARGSAAAWPARGSAAAWPARGSAAAWPAGSAQPPVCAPGPTSHRSSRPSCARRVTASGDRAGARPAGTTVPLRDSRFPRSRAVPVRGPGRLLMTPLTGHGQMGRGPRLPGDGQDFRPPSAARGSSYTRCTELTTASYDNRLARGPPRGQSVHPCDELAGQSLIAAVKPGLGPFRPGRCARWCGGAGRASRPGTGSGPAVG